MLLLKVDRLFRSHRACLCLFVHTRRPDFVCSEVFFLGGSHTYQLVSRCCRADLNFADPEAFCACRFLATNSIQILSLLEGLGQGLGAGGKRCGIADDARGLGCRGCDQFWRENSGRLKLVVRLFIARFKFGNSFLTSISNFRLQSS